MAGIAFSVSLKTGLRLARRLQSDAVKDALSKPFRNLVLKIERLAKMATVVDTGRLRASITHNFLGPVSAEVGSNVNYAEFIEYGTIRMAARHLQGGVKVLGQGMFDATVGNLGASLSEDERAIAQSLEIEVVRGAD